MSLDLIAYVSFFLTMALTYAIMCLGLNLQWGQTGLFNVGIAAFVAIGAYISALLTTPDAADRVGGFDLPIAVGWIGGAMVAGFAAWLVGALTIRLRSIILQSPRSALRSPCSSASLTFSRSPVAPSASASYPGRSAVWQEIHSPSASPISR